MDVINWLFSIEGKIVFITGNHSLMDLQIAINGFLEAERYHGISHKDPFFPGFQSYVEGVYGITMTAKGWARLIKENTADDKDAIRVFYKLLRDYAETIDESTIQ